MSKRDDPDFRKKARDHMPDDGDWCVLPKTAFETGAGRGMTPAELRELGKVPRKMLAEICLQRSGVDKARDFHPDDYRDMVELLPDS